MSNPVSSGSFLGQRVTLHPVPKFRIPDAAELLGVSDDTVRRWIDHGQLPVEREQSRRMVIDGAALAAFAQDHAHTAPDPRPMLAAQTVIGSSGWSPMSSPTP